MTRYVVGALASGGKERNACSSERKLSIMQVSRTIGQRVQNTEPKVVSFSVSSLTIAVSINSSSLPRLLMLWIDIVGRVEVLIV